MNDAILQTRSKIAKLAEDISNLGYTVSQEPSRVPGRALWQDGLETLFMSKRPRPDLLVKAGDKFVLIEVKTSDAMLGDVIRAYNFAEHFSAEVVLCVLTEAPAEMPSSLKSFAEDNGITLCSQFEIEAVLKEIFG